MKSITKRKLCDVQIIGTTSVALPCGIYPHHMAAAFLHNPRKVTD